MALTARTLAATIATTFTGWLAARTLTIRALTARTLAAAIATTFTGRLTVRALTTRALSTRTLTTGWLGTRFGSARALTATWLAWLTFRLDIDFRYEAFHDNTLELAVEQTLDTVQLLALITGYQ